MKIKSRNIIVAIILVFSLVSCNLTKKITQTKENANSQDISHLSGKEILKKVETIQPNFNTAYFKKMTIDLKSEKDSISFQATCKIQKNSAIHFSIRPFMGIELFKVELTPKNIVVVDKMNGIYYKEDYTILKKMLGMDMDFEKIEALLSNRIIFERSNYILTKDSAEYFYFKDENEQDIIIKNIIIDKKGKFVNMLTIDYLNTVVTMADYSDFELSDKILFPHKIRLATALDKTYYLDFSIRKIAFNQPLRLRNTNLSRYKKGDIQKLLPL